MLSNLSRSKPTKSVLVIQPSHLGGRDRRFSEADFRTSEVANQLIISFSHLRQPVDVVTQIGSMSKITSLKPVSLEDPNLATVLSKTTINPQDVKSVIAIYPSKKSFSHMQPSGMNIDHEARLSDLQASLRDELSTQNQLLNVVTITKPVKFMRGQQKQTLWVIFNKAKPQEPLDRKESPSVDYFLDLPKKNEKTA